jgi:DNA invertase Pin-like site-specific DNA recombinase
MKRPVAYLRKSKVTSDRHVSWEVQEAEVRQLAARHGDKDLVVLSDWSKSGRGSKTRLRGQYSELRAMIERGEVSALYGYSLSRLARSTRELLDLGAACATAGVRVRLAKEGDLDFTTSHGRLYLTVLAAVATFEAEVAGERTADAVRARRDRGDALGIAPYGFRLVKGNGTKRVTLEGNPDEPVAPITEAYRVAGSAFGAARLLNMKGITTRRGASWTGKVVGDVLRRAGVITERRPKPGVKSDADWTLYRLLVCPACGNVLTAGDRESPRYTCYRSRQGGHPRPFGIAESRLIEAVKAEAALLQGPTRISIAVEQGRRAELGVKRERVIDAYVSGLIDKADRARRLDAIDAEEETLDAECRVVDVPDTIDFTWAPRDLNRVLRALWTRIDLNAALMPVRFVWRVPEWRASPTPSPQ